jgi:hypothetical protein
MFSVCMTNNIYIICPNTMLAGIYVSCNMTHLLKLCYVPIFYTGEEDHSVKIWDIKEGRLLRSFDGICDDLECAVFCDDDRIVLVQRDSSTNWLGFGTNTGDMVYTLRRESAAACIGGQDKSIIGLFTETEVVLYDSTTGKQSAVIPHPCKVDFHSSSSIAKGKSRTMWFLQTSTARLPTVTKLEQAFTYVIIRHCSTLYVNRTK